VIGLGLVSARHPKTATLELYVVNRLTEPRLGRLEEHLLLCAECQGRVAALDAYHAVLKEALRDLKAEVHCTKDGLIYNWVEVLPNGRYAGRHRGATLDGGSDFATQKQAKTFLERSFEEREFRLLSGHKDLRGRTR
jgi:hypothetical protein